MNAHKNVFLVDDDLDDQSFFIDAIIEIENATLFGVASNGKEALNKLENSVELPAVIFMDVHMPVMDGIECLAEIIKNPLIRNIPVVMLTSDTGKIELARQFGAKAFINKSVSGKILREQVEQMINLDFIADSFIANQTFQTASSAFSH